MQPLSPYQRVLVAVCLICLSLASVCIACLTNDNDNNPASSEPTQ